MALTDLLRSLDDDAARDLRALHAEQVRRADDIVAKARADADHLVSQARANATAAAHRQAQALLHHARADAQRELTDTAYRELEALLSEVQQRLHRLTTEPSGAEATRRLLAEALEVLPEATACWTHPSQVAAVQEAFPGLTVSGDLDCVGAVVADDHGRSVDNTGPTRLVHAWPDLRAGFVSSWGSS